MGGTAGGDDDHGGYRRLLLEAGSRKACMWADAGSW